MWGLKHRSYSCERCGKAFVSHTALRYHFQAKHLGRVHCETCGREILREALQQHAKTDHEHTPTGNPRICCNMSFKRETKFVAMETSTSCRMCPKHFGTVRAREHHEKQEHHFTASKRAQMSIGFKPENILGYKTSAELEKHLEVTLRPTPGLIRITCASEVDALIALIKDMFPLPVAYVVKGGSYIKGTDTQDWSDVDVVLFSDAFESLEDCKRKTPELIEELKKRLVKSSWTNRLLMKKQTPFSFRFYFKCYKNRHGHSFDIMPCYNMVGPTPSEGLKECLYQKLYYCNDSDQLQFHMMALLKYQVEFVKGTTERVKDLIRLVKHWFKMSFAKPTKENKFRRFPSSYAVELISIYVWELAGKPIFFSFVQGMRAVLLCLVRYQEICIIWHKYYRPTCTVFQKVILKQTRPFILDPANPSFNVCENSNAWDEVAHVAKESLRKPLFKGTQAKEPWLFTNNW